MINIKDLNTHIEYSDITVGGVVIGQTITQYRVKRYDDIKNLTEKKSYLITCTQRIIIPNKAKFSPAPAKNPTFNDYPALLTNEISIKSVSGSGDITFNKILDYSPKTLNTTVMSSEDTSNSSGESSSKEHTTGSSTSQTNSYSVSANIGFFGDLPTGGVSGSYGHSDTKTHSKSDSEGSSSSHGNQLSDEDSMSIKDWGSYAIMDNENQTPTWVWSQEFPWNVALFKDIDANNNVILPAYVQKRLYDGKTLYPPTELSLFGINFVSKASWIIAVNNQVLDVNTGDITFSHILNYTTASHGVTKGQLSVLMNSQSPVTITSKPINLDLLALESISFNRRANNAVIGFIKNKFTIPPAPKEKFLIISNSNNLLVNGSGFTDVMETDFSDGAVDINVFFKVTETYGDYTFFMKAWKTAKPACEVTISVNDYLVTTKRIDFLESEGGGTNNIVSVFLRNTDYTSVDYHDYLKLGLNSIKITITPEANSTGAMFCIRALGINNY